MHVATPAVIPRTLYFYLEIILYEIIIIAKTYTGTEYDRLLKV